MSEVSQDKASDGADHIDFDTFEPTTEAERFSFDLGHEDGWQVRNAELLDAFEATLEQLISDLRAFAAEARAA